MARVAAMAGSVRGMRRGGGAEREGERRVAERVMPRVAKISGLNRPPVKNEVWRQDDGPAMGSATRHT